MKPKFIDVEAERSYIAGLLINGELIYETSLTPKDFHDQKCKAVFNSMLKISKEKDVKIDIVSIADKLKFGDSVSYLANLTSDYGFLPAKKLDNYEKIIKKRSNQRKEYENAQRIMQMLENDEDTSQIREELYFQEDSEMELPTDIKSLALDYDEEYDKEDKTGLMFGIPAIDDVIYGVAGGELIGVTGESGAGKTAFCLNIALKVSQEGKKVLYVNLEMNNKDIVGRLISMYSGVDNSELRRKRMDRSVVDTALAKLSELNLKILSPSSMTSAEVFKTARIEKQKNGLDLIVVDYINELADEGAEEKDVIEHALRNLKAMAVKLDVPVIVPYQMSYAGLNRPTPTQQDGRSSSKIANVMGVMFSLKNNPTPEISLEAGQREVDLWITKNRHGVSRIKIPLRFEQQTLRFLE